MARQLPLFSSQPTQAQEISKQTPLKGTYDLFRQYLIKEGKSEHTVKAFLADLRLFGQYTQEETPVGDYRTGKLNEFLDWMENGRGVSCSRKTYARRVTTLKVYFKWLKELKAIPNDPALAVLQRSGPAPLAEVLTPQQVDDVIAVAERQKKGERFDTRPELLFRLLLQTGIKKSETGRLTLEHIERHEGKNPTILIRHKARNVYKERRIPVEPEWLDLLDRYIAQYEITDEIFTCTTRNLEYIITALGKEAGVPFKLSFEGMRWTMAVRNWRDGVEGEKIREKMGLSETSWYETGAKIRRLAQQQADAEREASDHQ